MMLCCTCQLFGQQATTISGTLIDKITQRAVDQAHIQLDGIPVDVVLELNGNFKLTTEESGPFILQISVKEFAIKKFDVYLNGVPIELGTIYLEKDITLDKTDNLVSISEDELADDEATISGTMGLLQATRDIFLTRAAFDFGQAFFKVRGYDSQYGQVMINGMPMNKTSDGRPQWNNWGGLNDVIRNQTFTYALELNPFNFGGILGNTNIDLRPSGFRPGIRVSSSMSNRTYKGRLMATYSSGKKAGKLTYAISGSRRWADSGFVDGTLYDAYSFFAALEYKWNPQNSVSLATMIARNRRGRSAALTEEVFELFGNRYNPYWGKQNGDSRNSRERRIFEPFVSLTHVLETPKLKWTSAVAYQTGIQGKSRLSYFNAPNPDPTYYKYLPSSHINGSFGADFTNAALARQGLLSHPQLNWEQIYLANSNAPDGEAAYVLSEDVVEERRWIMASSLAWEIGEHTSVGVGANMENSIADYYGKLSDLLGADFHFDADSFSQTRNDVLGPTNKVVGDKMGYHYALNSKRMSGFAQMQVKFNKWHGFGSVSYSGLRADRDGLFQNERYLENSLGKSEAVNLGGIRYKGGLTFFLSGRHWLTATAASLDRPPILQNIWVNPRENNLAVPQLGNENITSVDLSYFIRLPDLTSRFSAYYTRFQYQSDINFFFVDSGLGSDFVQEVIIGMDKLHKGLELGLEYQVSNQVKLSLAGNLGNYVFANNPDVQLYFDTSGPEEDLINAEGSVDLGEANLKGLKLSQGPQTALAFGVEYRSDKYWWIGTTANYLDDNFSNLSTIKRTESFLLDPETNLPLSNIQSSEIDLLLRQQRLDKIYLLNLVGGKSWLVKKKYVSAFVSINNLFDSVFRTGGYEQSRNGNYKQMVQDNASGTPSFGPKYWYSYGRTFFLNLALNF